MNVFRSLSARVRERLRPARHPVLGIDDPGLRVVVEAFDEAEAASTALGRASHWDSALPAVLRHHLRIPARHVPSVRSLVEQDGWVLREYDSGDGSEDASPLQDQETTTAVIALRVQQLDALHCAQESSRMAGLAQRFQGRALGWDALQPETAG